MHILNQRFTNEYLVDNIPNEPAPTCLHTKLMAPSIAAIQYQQFNPTSMIRLHTVKLLYTWLVSGYMLCKHSVYNIFNKLKLIFLHSQMISSISSYTNHSIHLICLHTVKQSWILLCTSSNSTSVTCLHTLTRRSFWWATLLACLPKKWNQLHEFKFCLRSLRTNDLLKSMNQSVFLLFDGKQQGLKWPCVILYAWQKGSINIYVAFESNL